MTWENKFVRWSWLPSQWPLGSFLCAASLLIQSYSPAFEFSIYCTLLLAKTHCVRECTQNSVVKFVWKGCTAMTALTGRNAPSTQPASCVQRQTTVPTQPLPIWQSLNKQSLFGSGGQPSRLPSWINLGTSKIARVSIRNKKPWPHISSCIFSFLGIQIRFIPFLQTKKAAFPIRFTDNFGNMHKSIVSLD